MEDLKCVLCGTPETQRPLLAARFEHKDVHVCPGCMPALIHGAPPEEIAKAIRNSSHA